MCIFCHKRAFTLIELLFVIVVIGILTAILAPRFTKPTLTEAAHQIVSHIRYTQHLAMMDNRFDLANEFWYKERWQLKFHKTVNSKLVWSYSIFSDKIGISGKHTGNPDLKELARNPLNTFQFLSGGFAGGVVKINGDRSTSSMALVEKYGIKHIRFLGGFKSARRIAFDYLGRPIRGDISSMKKSYTKLNMVQKRCILQLCLDKPCDTSNIDRYIEIAIEPETGYTHIL